MLQKERENGKQIEKLGVMPTEVFKEIVVALLPQAAPQFCAVGVSIDQQCLHHPWMTPVFFFLLQSVISSWKPRC